MMSTDQPDHEALAEAVRQRVLQGPGETAADLRQRVAARAAGGPAIEAPYEDVARQVGILAARVTDAQVKELVAAAGSDKAAFELVVAAAVGAGLLRWQRGLAALEEAMDAPA
jgi:hypothetical protein